MQNREACPGRICQMQFFEARGYASLEYDCDDDPTGKINSRSREGDERHSCGRMVQSSLTRGRMSR